MTAGAPSDIDFPVYGLDESVDSDWLLEHGMANRLNRKLGSLIWHVTLSYAHRRSGHLLSVFSLPNLDAVAPGEYATHIDCEDARGFAVLEMAAALRDGPRQEAYPRAQAAPWVPARLLVEGVDHAAELCTTLPGTAGIMADLPGGSVSASVQGELPDLALVRMNDRLPHVLWL